MSWTWQRERAYWAGEIPRLLRGGIWLIALLFLLSFLSMFHVVGVVMNALIAAVPLMVVVRRVLAARDFDGVLDRRWQRKMTKWILGNWPGLARSLRLEARGPQGAPIVASCGKPNWQKQTCMLPVALPPGLVREDLVNVTGHLAQAFAASRVSVVGEHLGRLALRIEYVDVLARAFTLPLGLPWDGRTVVMGVAEGGDQWRLSVGPHTLIAGSSGSGKASLVWGLLLGLAQPIHQGLIEVWGIDRKGGMELAMGRDLLTRFADDAAHSVVLLEEAVAQMQKRARALAGITRQHVATPDSPTIIVLIDELAALTAYETDREMLRRANAAIATLASQGRAVGFVLFACLQDPRKETLPARGLFTQTVGLRLRDRMETAMVLGDGAVAAGALCHEISSSTPGVAYVLSDSGAAPQRVRAAFADDDQIREAALTYFAPHPKPVTIPETTAEQDTSGPRRPRTRRTRKTTDNKEES